MIAGRLGSAAGVNLPPPRGRWVGLAVTGGRRPDETVRILVVRPDHLGDVLVTLPALAEVRRAWPCARIGYAVAEPVAAVCARCPAVDDVASVAFPPIQRPWQRLGDPAVRAAARRLMGAYDMAVLPRPDDPSSGVLCAAAGVPVRVGFAMPRTRPFLTHALPPPGRTHVALMTHAVLAAGLAVFGAPPLPPPGGLANSIRPTRPDEREADGVLAAAGVGSSPVVLHPGSGWRLKNWPAGRWGDVARRLREVVGTRLLVAGTAGETALVDAAAVASNGAAVGIAGLLSLGGLAALHARARLVVGVDSGALHLAAAVGTPTVALYGPGDPVQYAAAGAGHRVVRSGLPCSPCGTLERPPCGAITDPACVTGVPANAVVAAAVALLRRSADLRR